MADRYQIKGRIGRGGIGAIYLAYDTVLKRDVAIKRLLPLEETNLNESAENTLTREAEALSRLQHPNVITLFAFEEDEEGPFVVMEYIEGDTLKDTIDNGALSYEDFQIVANQCLDPLITARELGLLHRDIKPANIMLQWLSSGSFQVKILDFGLAKFSQAPSLQTLDQTGSFLGSIEYLAPEQLELKPLDQRTDLYSLGCVLYFCLAQRSPFEGTNPAMTTTNHLAHVVTHISEVREDIPKPVADWLMLLLSRQPDDRPVDAREALKLFKSSQAGESPQIASATPAAAIPVSAPVAPVNPPPPTHSGPIHTAVAEVSGPVAPPASVSGPIAVAVAQAIPVPAPNSGSTTKRLITSPQTPVSGETGPRKLITGTGPISTSTGQQTVSVPPSTKTGRIAKIPTTKIDKEEASPQADSTIEKLKQQSPLVWVVVGLLVVVIILLGYLVLKKDKDGVENTDSADSTSLLPAPPITKGLQLQLAGARYVLSTHTDAPLEGEKQLLIASPNPSLHLFTTLAEAKGSKVLLSEALQSDHPELNRPHPALILGEGASIAFRVTDNFFFKSDQLTCIIVLKAKDIFSDIFRASTRTDAEKIRPRINNGFYNEMPVGNKRVKISTSAPTDHFVVLTFIWDGSKETQQIFVVDANGKRYDSQVGTATKEPVEFSSFYIGDAYDEEANRATGKVLEFALYDRALPESERTNLENYFRNKYFN
ncbi:MAG: protein kinase [Verrucomicrobiales bacterium]|nr:protein kinase [Verrucomicrobiales bacterium]